MVSLATLAAVYWAVLVAELIGDKSIYAVASLALRFQWGIVLAAIVLAFSLKMGVAVLLGSMLVRLPMRIVTVVSALAFLGSALAIGFRPDEERPPEHVDWRRGAAACFVSLFLTEWADPGQIVTAASAARFHVPATVWLAGTLALITKGILALVLGFKLRDRLPQRLVRTVAQVSLIVLAVGTLAQFR